MEIDPYLLPVQNSPPNSQRPLHKTRYYEPDRKRKQVKKKNVQNCLQAIGTGKDFLNRPLIAKSLRSTINKWTSRD